MPDKVELKLIGAENVRKAIDQYKTYKRIQIQGATKEVGLRVLRDAQRKCPVKEGRLRGSISTNWTGSGMAKGKVSSPAKSDDGIGQPSGSQGEFIVVTGTNVVYGRRIELGFIGRDKLKRRYNQRPRPYLYPAFHANSGKLRPKIEQILKKID